MPSAAPSPSPSEWLTPDPVGTYTIDALKASPGAVHDSHSLLDMVLIVLIGMGVGFCCLLWMTGVYRLQQRSRAIKTYAESLSPIATGTVEPRANMHAQLSAVASRSPASLASLHSLGPSMASRFAQATDTALTTPVRGENANANETEIKYDDDVDGIEVNPTLDHSPSLILPSKAMVHF